MRHGKTFGYLLLPLILATCLGTPSPVRANAGLAFLRIGVGARAMGLAGAYTAVANDVTATYWNPAGLTHLARTETYFSHSQWFADARSEFLGLGFGLKTLRLGFSLYYFTIGGIERRVKPSPEPLGVFSAHDLCLGVTLARSFDSNFKVGVTLKGLFEKIYLESSWGLALDFGVLLRLSDTPLQVGLALRNIGWMSAFRQQHPRLPSLFQTGLAYKTSILGNHTPFLLSLDYALHSYQQNRLLFGAELSLPQGLALRGGIRWKGPSIQPHFGLGFNLRRLSLSYSYSPFPEGLGSTQLFSLRMRW